jgi:hypothetical protein
MSRFAGGGRDLVLVAGGETTSPDIQRRSRICPKFTQRGNSTRVAISRASFSKSS